MPHLSGEEDRLSPRFRAFAVTLSVFAGFGRALSRMVGNACPFPALKAGLSPFSAHLRWVPHRSQQFRSGTRGPPRPIYSKI